MNVTYLRMEILRTFRVPRFYIFTLLMPVLLYVLLVGVYGKGTLDGAAVSAWFMVSMAVFGAMGAATSVGGRIAIERAVGWTRQLRLTPLSGRAYLAGKAATSLVVAIPSLLLLYATGRIVKHVSLHFSTWAEIFGWTLLGLLPFVALGILLGHLVSGDALAAIAGGLYTVLALIGGVWFPVDQMPHTLASIARATPAYWLAEAGRAPLSGHTIGLHGVEVILVWTAALGVAAVRRYLRDTART
jgi:ABC-2 type transport system permease protein